VKTPVTNSRDRTAFRIRIYRTKWTSLCTHSRRGSLEIVFTHYTCTRMFGEKKKSDEVLPRERFRKFFQILCVCVLYKALLYDNIPTATGRPTDLTVEVSSAATAVNGKAARDHHSVFFFFTLLSKTTKKKNPPK